MSEPVSKAEIEDVLSSIRRLVSENANAIRRDQEAAPSADKLVLTPAFRVDEDEADEAADEAAPERAETERDEAATIAAVAGVVGAARAVEDEGADVAVEPEDEVETAEARPLSPLEQRIAELEAAISRSATEFEPDGSEIDDIPDNFVFHHRALDARPEGAEEHGEFREAEAVETPVPEEAGRGATVEAFGQSEPEHLDDTGEQADAEDMVEPEEHVEPEEMAEPEAFDEPDDLAHADDLALAEEMSAVADLAALDGVEPLDEPEIEAAGEAAVEQVEEAEVVEAASAVADLAEDATESAAGPEAAEGTWPEEDLEAEAWEPETVEDAPAVTGEAEDDWEEVAATDWEDEDDSSEAVIDEDALREMVARMVREELQGTVGERITQNVRRMVRREIARALSLQDLE